MALSYDTTVLTGKYHKFNDAPASGYVEIIPNSPAVVDGVGNVILAGRVKVKLDDTGAFSVALPSTDDTSLEPATNRRYTVVPKLDHANSLGAVTGFELPAGAGVDLADVISQIETDPVFSSWFTQSDYDDLIARVDDLETDTSDGTITSVNGNTGPMVVLTAASVGARPDTYVPTWSEVMSKPTAFPPSTHGHASTDISDFTEAAQDAVAAMLASGANVTLSYNDAGNTLQVTASGTDAEVVRDTIGAAIAGINGVTVAVNDAADTITLSVTGLTIAQTTGLQTALDDLTTAVGNKVNSSTYTAGLAAKQALQQVAATVSASGAAVVNKHNPVDATTGALSLSLPTGQAEGTQVGVEKVDSSVNNVSITGNIRGVAASTIPLSYLSESLMLRADAAGSWWPISGHRTKTTLDAAYFAKAAPTPAGVRTRQFDPLSNIYGSPTARATSRRALGFALGSAKTSLVNIAIAGDSFSQGHKAGVVGTDDWATNLKGLLKAAGYPVTGGWVHAATGNATSGDARWTFGGTWSRSDTTANYAYGTGAAGATATFTSDDTGTILEFAGFSTAASCTYTVDGGSAVTWNLTANQINVLTLTGLSAGTHTVTITRTQSSGTLYVVAARCRNATGLSISNGAIFGSHTADWVPTAKNTAGTAGADISWLNPYKIMQTLAGAAPKLVLLCLGGNDSQHAGYTLAGMKTNLAAIVAAYQAAGTTVVQRVYTYPSTLGIAAAAAGSPMATGTSWDAFVSAMYDVSDTYDTALIDHSTVLGDSNTLEAAGMAYSDHLHLLTPGQAAVARADFRALQAV